MSARECERMRVGVRKRMRVHMSMCVCMSVSAHEHVREGVHVSQGRLAYLTEVPPTQAWHLTWR